MIKLSKLKDLKFIYLNKYFTLMSADGLISKNNFFKKLMQDFKILIYHFNFFLYSITYLKFISRFLTI